MAASAHRWMRIGRPSPPSPGPGSMSSSHLWFRSANRHGRSGRRIGDFEPFRVDKSQMFIDNVLISPHYGRIYVVWTTNIPRVIQLSHSDNGTTWSTPKTISGGVSDDHGPAPTSASRPRCRDVAHQGDLFPHPVGPFQAMGRRS